MKKSFLALLVVSCLLSGCGVLASGLSNMDPTALAPAANTASDADNTIVFIYPPQPPP